MMPLKRKMIAEVLKSIGVREKGFVKCKNLAGILKLAKHSLEQKIKEAI
jgi:hypothetical protein